MNKLAIPAILVATVMVAGMFAFAPVEQASTVHTTGTAQGTATVEQTNTSAGEDITLTCGSSAGCVIAEIWVTDNATTDTVLASVTSTIRGDAITILSSVTNSGSGGTTDIISTDNAGEAIVLPAGESLVIVVTSSSADYTVTLVSSGAITISFA